MFRPGTYVLCGAFKLHRLREGGKNSLNENVVLFSEEGWVTKKLTESCDIYPAFYHSCLWLGFLYFYKQTLVKWLVLSCLSLPFSNVPDIPYPDYTKHSYRFGTVMLAETFFENWSGVDLQCFMSEIMPFAAILTWMELEIIILSEVSQKENDK